MKPASNAGKRAGKRARDQAAIGFSFASDWLSRWREFLDQLQSIVKQNQFNPILLSILD